MNQSRILKLKLEYLLLHITPACSSNKTSHSCNRQFKNMQKNSWLKNLLFLLVFSPIRAEWNVCERKVFNVFNFNIM